MLRKKFERESESESCSVVILCDSMDCAVRGILQARILEWVAFSFFRGSSQPRDQTQVSRTAGNSLPAEPQGKPKNIGVGSLFLLQQIFPTQESNWCLLHCRQILYQLSYQGSPGEVLSLESGRCPAASPAWSVRVD